MSRRPVSVGWRPLDSLVGDPLLYGQKVLNQKSAAEAGLPVCPSYILSADQLDARETFGTLAEELLGLGPGPWILRSSSALEDRPGQSAAGLFESPIAYHREGILAALETHRLARHDARLEPLLGAAPPYPLAILAQPLLKLEAWVAVELRPALEDGERFHMEGQPGRWRESLLRLADEAGRPGELLELGHDGENCWLLQRRPAPPRPPAGWRPDREHSPRPLCPLLRSSLATPILASAESRLIEGIWHERAKAPSVATAERAAAAYTAWYGGDRDALLGAADALSTAAPEGIPTPRAFPHFLGLWRILQANYFARGHGAIRRWALRELGPESWRRPAWLGSTNFGHDAPSPWDGLSPSVWEIARSGTSWLTAESAWPTPPTSTLEAARQGELNPHEALALGEEDDALLARLYALWRLSALQAAEELDMHDEDIFFVDAEELCGWLNPTVAAPPAQKDLEAAIREGRRLSASWQQHWRRQPRSPLLQGLAASAGKVEGPVCIRPRATGLPPGSILVVPTLTPMDARYFGGLSGIICEGGEALGHATLLAREAGIPCVLQVEEASRRLHDGQRIILDGDEGTILAIPDPA